MRFSLNTLKKLTALCMTGICSSCFVLFPYADELKTATLSEIKALKTMVLEAKTYYNVDYNVLEGCRLKNSFINNNISETTTTTAITTEISTAETTAPETSTEAVVTTVPEETTTEETTTTVRQPKPDIEYLTFGIDVSVHQGAINWEQVKNDGVDYAILRAGYGKYISQIDTKFETNYARCKSLGIPVGAYWYSYATTPEQAEIEVDAFLYAMKGKQFEYPVYLDLEDSTQMKLDRQTLTDIAIAFCSKLEEAGYYTGIYTNVYWTENLLYQSQLVDYDKWLAHWTSYPKYNSSFGGMWQYGAYGSVEQVELGHATMYGEINGISAACDVNVCYRDYPTIIKSKHFNGY